MNLETGVSRGGVDCAPSGASFVIIARRRRKIIQVLVVDDPTKYGRDFEGERTIRRIGFPGGTMLPGETPEKTGERELKEEVGLTVRLIPSLSDKLVEIPLPNDQGIDAPHVFRVFSTFFFHGEIKPGDGVARAFWVPVPDLINRSNLFFRHRDALEVFIMKFC